MVLAAKPIASASIAQLEVTSLPQLVAEKLRNAILDGTFKPGERLIEQKLATDFGIGQPTLREALKELELQGFARKKARKGGTYVTKLSQQDFENIQEVRMALEVRAIEKAALNLTAEAEADLERSVKAMEESARRFDLASFHQHDIQFHRRMWDLTGNEYLGIALERVAFGLFAFVLLQRPQESRNEFVAAARQHRDILDGLRSRNPKIAREAFIGSTANFWSEYHQVHFDEPAFSSPASEKNAIAGSAAGAAAHKRRRKH